jgi:outer membrane protein OmpA-like peptidoglycan-associated protein
MSRSLVTTGCSLTLLSASLIAATANAQTTEAASGFAINRFNPAERGSEWFALDSLDFRGHMRPALGITADYAHMPLVIYSGTGEERVALIQNQLFLHIGGSFLIAERLRVGVNLPVAVLNRGTDGTAEGFLVTAPTGAAVGDLRLGLDVRLFGAYGGPLTMALGAQVFVPTGDRASFTGDEKVRLLPRLSLAGSAGVLTYAAMFGVQYRALDEGFVGKDAGTEITGGASLGLRALNGKLVIGPEFFGSKVIATAVQAPSPSKSPVEFLMGVHYTAGQIRLGAGAGPGLTRGIGTPKFRALASLEWAPPSDVDTDGDGIFNKLDACVTIAGPASADPKKHGCPLDRDNDKIYDKDDACPGVPGAPNPDRTKHGCPTDRDGDTIYDKEDACPDVLGAPSQDAKMHGCPQDQSTGVVVLLDLDADGVMDENDKCVDVPGLKEPPAGLTDEQKANWTRRFLGCPEDVDKDKILNMVDACPNNPGKANKDPLKHGCPLALIDACEIRITDRVYFKTSSDTIETQGEKGKTSLAVLMAVVELLKENPHVTKVEVAGHASQDTSPRNQELSEQRAAAVVTWLVQHGVDAKRLAPKGYGTTRPAPGVSMEKAYKELHQRVAFYVLEPQCNKPAPAN